MGALHGEKVDVCMYDGDVPGGGVDVRWVHGEKVDVRMSRCDCMAKTLMNALMLVNICRHGMLRDCMAT